jgi:aspartate 1-decarboxylase
MCRVFRLGNLEMIEIIRAKLHGLRVTGADVAYHGSITLDPEHCAAAGIFPLEFVNVWNKNTGARISTYVIFGKPGSRCCNLNGAAARTCQIGDEVIITATETIDPKDLATRKPKVLTFTPGNDVAEILQYRVAGGKERPYDFFLDKLK